MSPFTPLHLIENGDKPFVVGEPFSYTLPCGRKITVPAGFPTDGASIPRIFIVLCILFLAELLRIFGTLFSAPRLMVWLAIIALCLVSLIPAFGRHSRAAVIHDYLYYLNRERFADYGRANVDWIFLQAMKDSGVRFTRRWVMYLGVRAFGWLPGCWN